MKQDSRIQSLEHNSDSKEKAKEGGCYHAMEVRTQKSASQHILSWLCGRLSGNICQRLKYVQWPLVAADLPFISLSLNCHLYRERLVYLLFYFPLF